MLQSSSLCNRGNIQFIIWCLSLPIIAIAWDLGIADADQRIADLWSAPACAWLLYFAVLIKDQQCEVSKHIKDQHSQVWPIEDGLKKPSTYSYLSKISNKPSTAHLWWAQAIPMTRWVSCAHWVLANKFIKKKKRDNILILFKSANHPIPFRTRFVKLLFARCTAFSGRRSKGQDINSLKSPDISLPTVLLGLLLGFLLSSTK